MRWGRTSGVPAPAFGSARHLVAWIGGTGALSPTRVPGYAMGTYFGRPSSSIRFSTSPCCMDRRYGRTEPDPCSGLCDGDVLRASQLQHSVQHVTLLHGSEVRAH